MDLSDILSDLVSFKTITGHEEQTEACFDYIREFLTKYSIKPKAERSNDFRSLVASTQDTKSPKILLQAHIDVVPAGEKGFYMREDNGRLYGRGVFDMKFAAACYLKLIDDLSKDLKSYDFGIMLTSDEEVGGEDGVDMLLHKGYSTNVCILPDAGDNWNIETECKGAWFIRISAEGKSAHGSRPWEGNNAIEKLVKALDSIRKLFKDQDDKHSTITISKIRGGTAINQVPDYAEASIDIRYMDESKYGEKYRKIHEIARESQLNLETVKHCIKVKCDIKQPEVSKFIKIAEKVGNKSLGHSKSLGTSDARYFYARGIPTVLIRPVGGGAHSEEEWIDKAELEKFYEVLKAYVTETAKIA